MKKEKRNKYATEEQMEIKRFVFVLLGLLLIIVGIYFFTRAFVTKDLFKNNNEISYVEGKINYDAVVVGTMLNRPYKEYYVIAYSNENNNSSYYNTVVSKYTQKTKKEKIYYLDLDNVLNQRYVAKEKEEVSKTFTDRKNLKLGDITLLKIKNGKVEKYITTIEEIKKEFGV